MSFFWPTLSSGQQYAFEIDLGQCTGCKSCVTACHNRNGLATGETWRHVGVMRGSAPSASETAPFSLSRFITHACHHCVDPACLRGCPVHAYEKDPLTGIVKHLDDQCIGCRYCLYTCPFDVPQYNEELGIVRKCDMCSSRLRVGEAPACIQGCLNGAISIAAVDRNQLLRSAEQGEFLPGVPSPEHTIPSTQYVGAAALPADIRPTDFGASRRGDAHTSLVLMLVLTQGAVGTFSFEFLSGFFISPSLSAFLRPLWRGAPTAMEFIGTTVTLGAMGSFCALAIARSSLGATAAESALETHFDQTALLCAVLMCLKLLIEGRVFAFLRHRRDTWLRRSAALMAFELRDVTVSRYALGVLGGIFLPLVLSVADGAQPSLSTGLMTVAFTALLLTLVGELFARYLCIAHPVLWGRICRNPHQPTIVVIDPRRTETAEAAHLHLSNRPGSDLVLFSTIARLLIERGQIDERFVTKHTSGLEELKTTLAYCDTATATRIGERWRGFSKSMKRSCKRG